MKSLVITKYGSPDFIELKDIPKPTPKENEVLVRVHATTVNDYDWSLMRGQPFIYRLMFGFQKPRVRPGMELSGTVEAVGDNVSTLKVGDAVYGDTSNHGFGTFAEYMSVNEKALLRKPENMSFEEAAAIPHAAMLAYQGLVKLGEIQNGQKILINGAGGGVGTFALQLAQLYDAEVTGVDTGPKLEMMKALGFDHLIDYKKQDFTRNGERYDLVLDAKTNRSTFAYLRSLKPHGKYVTVGGHLGRLLQLVLLKPIISALGNKSVFLLGLRANKDLAYIKELFEAGKIKPVIDGPYPLEKTPELIQYFGEGKHAGKVVITVSD